jgi:tRNA pseudouridine-54 N-methylase
VPDLSTDQITLALAIVASVALLCLLATIFLSVKLRKAREQYALLRGEGEPKDIFSIVGRTLKQIGNVERRIDGVVVALEEQTALSRFAIQRFGLVRYNAFEEMGGQLSFSAAFLDDHGDGIVISSINGRTETRTYAKSVKGLTSPHNLSDEEREAIATASSGSSRIEADATATR